MKNITLSIVGAIVVIIAVLVFTQGKVTFGNSQNIDNVNNVTVVDGKQIIEIKAKGGYQPRSSVAKAGVPTIIRFDTSGTFDCSSSVRIPSLNVSKVLPQSGVTDIDIGNSQLGLLQGTCGMGMYRFDVDFRS